VNSQAVYQRMQTERQREAADLRANGQQQAQTIRARAEREAVVILAEANRRSEELRGSGDAEKNRILAEAFGSDPDFFTFYRSMQAYEQGLKAGDTRMVLSPTSDFFRYFNDPSGRGGRPNAAGRTGAGTVGPGSQQGAPGAQPGGPGPQSLAPAPQSSPAAPNTAPVPATQPATAAAAAGPEGRLRAALTPQRPHGGSDRSPRPRSRGRGPFVCAFPDAARRAMVEAAQTPSDRMRYAGIASAVVGVVIVWLARQLLG
jgi:uncharacterized protein YjeT (DUF2065 family)